MELFATTGDAFVRVGAHTRLEGSGAQCLALDGDAVYVGCRGGGLMRTDDGGASFSDHRPEAARDVHCLAWHPSASGRAYEAGGDGAAWSRDRGRRWGQAGAG